MNWIWFWKIIGFLFKCRYSFFPLAPGCSYSFLELIDTKLGMILNKSQNNHWNYFPRIELVDRLTKKILGINNRIIEKIWFFFIIMKLALKTIQRSKWIYCKYNFSYTYLIMYNWGSRKRIFEFQFSFHLAVAVIPTLDSCCRGLLNIDYSITWQNCPT